MRQLYMRCSKNQLLEVLRGSSCMGKNESFVYLFLQQKRLLKQQLIWILGKELEYLAVGLKLLCTGPLETLSFSGRSNCFFLFMWLLILRLRPLHSNGKNGLNIFIVAIKTKQTPPKPTTLKLQNFVISLAAFVRFIRICEEHSSFCSGLQAALFQLLLFFHSQVSRFA